MIAPKVPEGRGVPRLRGFVSALVICASATLIAQAPPPLDLVIVNGVVTGRSGIHTGAKAGQVVTLSKK